MEKKYFIGIDFGHGETTVSRVPGYNGQVVSQIPLKSGDNAYDKKVISAICYKNDNWSLVLGESDYHNDSLHEGFKGIIQDLSDESSKALRIFAQLIFERILEADGEIEYKSVDERNFVLGIACPTEWSSKKAKDTKFKNAREEYLDFFRSKCKLPVDFCINESDAAFFTKYNYDNTTESVFVIDLGSSTIDFTTFVNSKVNEKLCWGSNLGAHRIEDIILSNVLEDDNNRTNLQRVNQMRHEANYVNADVTHALSLFIRKAKEKYYIDNMDYIDVNIMTRSFFAKHKAAHFCILWGVYKDEYERIIAPYVQELQNEVIKAKQRLALNGITPARVILSGGAARMPFFEECVRKQFAGSKIDKDTEPECVVAHGVALYAKKLDEALNIFLDELKKIDYEYIFKRAYADAKSAAISELVPSVVNSIITGRTKGNDNGKFIREKFLDFLKNLDHNNYRYCVLVKNAINKKLSEKVASAISSAIEKVFMIRISTSDVEINTDPVIYHYLDECFVPGGFWYDSITEWIKDYSNTFLASIRFDWEEHIYSAERTQIANGVATCLKQHDSYSLDTYRNLDESVKDLVNQVMDLAEDVFNEQQLFETTFKQ